MEPNDKTEPSSTEPNARIREGYDDHVQGRADGMRERADRKLGEAASLRKRNDAIAGVMNGTPILVDHYSAGRHRRRLEKLWSDTGKEIGLRADAERLEKRADRAELGRAISADDPAALDKLGVKLAEAEAHHERVKLAIKVGKPAWEKGGVEGATRALLAAGFSADEVKRFSPFALQSDRNPWRFVTTTNATAEVRRLKKRIAELEAHRVSAPVDEWIGEVHLSEGDNRVRLRFPSKPSEAIREFLGGRGGHGFHWSPSLGVWQRQSSADALYWGRKAAAMTLPAEGSP